MKVIILFLIAFVFRNGFTGSVPEVISRWKRDTVGALDIITNNASPIHADVTSNIEKPKNATPDKPCPEKKGPSKIEPGVVFQVVPPKDTFYETRSLRKSFPLTSKLDLVRCITRIITLAAIVFSAAVEFYPVVVSLYKNIYDFVFFNKY